MNDLMVLAMQCDQTRVLSFMNGNAGSGRSYPFLGVSGAHHGISHHQGLQENHDKLTIIDTWEVQMLSNLLQKMATTVESDGSSLLDNSLVFFSSEIEDGNSHSHSNMPILLAGRGGGTVESGRHIVYPEHTPVANLMVRMMQIAGVEVESFGDSTGSLEGLTSS